MSFKLKLINYRSCCYFHWNNKFHEKNSAIKSLWLYTGVFVKVCFIKFGYIGFCNLCLELCFVWHIWVIHLPTSAYIFRFEIYKHSLPFMKIELLMSNLIELFIRQHKMTMVLASIPRRSNAPTTLSANYLIP